MLENLEIAAEEGAETALKAAAMRSQLTAEQLQVCAVGWLGRAVCNKKGASTRVAAMPSQLTAEQLQVGFSVAGTSSCRVRGMNAGCWHTCYALSKGSRLGGDQGHGRAAAGGDMGQKGRVIRHLHFLVCCPLL